jgi:hypothetical protein
LVHPSSCDGEAPRVHDRDRHADAATLGFCERDLYEPLGLLE